MAGLGYAFFGISYLGSFVVIHLVMKRLLRDPYNIEFKNSLSLTTASSLALWFATLMPFPLNSLGGIIVFLVSVILLWKLSEHLFGFGWWEGLLAGLASALCFPLFFFGSAWIWSRIFLQS